jgi:molybdopterin-guanine dinucleotide biosynthesis protein A
VQTSGLVLAGGRSSRFGSDKLAARIDGVTILERAVRTLAGLSDDVIVVIGPSSPEPELPGDLPHRFVRDREAFHGPLAGVAAGLAAVGADVVVVVAGDMPFVQLDVVRAMLQVAAERRAEAVALVDDGQPRPIPCVLRTEHALAAARSLLDVGERRLRALLDALPLTAIDESTWTRLDPERRTLVDVDEPGDLPR